jgi:hypothetical protein
MRISAAPPRQPAALSAQAARLSGEIHIRTNCKDRASEQYPELPGPTRAADAFDR